MIRMLIVDDEPHIRSGIAAKIEQANNPLWLISGEAGNGIEAMEWLRNYHADICLTDIRMHVMDGLSLINEVKHKYPWMQWVIISSYDDFSYAKQALQLGVTDYVLKPIDRQTLYECLTKTEEQLQKIRRERAYHLLVDKMEQLQHILQQWTHLIRTNQFDQSPLLVSNTLVLLEQWVDQEFYLLDALSSELIDLVVKQVKYPKFSHTLSTAKEFGFDSEKLDLSQARYYFRMTAVMRLEKSMVQLIYGLKKEHQYQNPRIVNQVKQYLDEHYADKITLDELAKQIPISRSYLTILFKQDTGKTVWEYLMDVRMRTAKLLLLDHNLKIYELANRIGYENSEHFSKLFKEYYGVTPKEYRRALEMNMENPSD